MTKERNPMAEYIERAKVTDALIDNTSIEGSELREAVNAICAIPAADVRPVVRGEWLPIIEANEYGETYQAGCYCSECNEVLQYEPNFCPNCGADMREES